MIIALTKLKSIPNSCEECEFRNTEAYAYPSCDVLQVELYDNEKKSYHCPLKLLPRQKEDLRYLDSYAKGFNDCLDEISGEKQ